MTVQWSSLNGPVPMRLLAQSGVVSWAGASMRKRPSRYRKPGELLPRPTGGDGDLLRPGGGDVGDVLERGADERALAVGVEVLDEGVGVERRAVVELDAVAERDLPLGEVGVRGDRLRQVRDHLVLGVRDHQRVVDGGADLDAGDGEAGRRRAPATAGLGLEAVDDRAAGLGAARRRGRRRDPREQGGGADDATSRSCRQLRAQCGADAWRSHRSGPPGPPRPVARYRPFRKVTGRYPTGT